MRKLKFMLVMALAGICLPAVSSHAQERTVGEIMRQKLKNSQRVLEGLAMNDFDKIADSASELVLLSKEAQWKVMKTPRYEVHSGEFRRTAEALVQMAKDRNLDGASLMYVDLTLTCVKCHKYVREARPPGDR